MVDGTVYVTGGSVVVVRSVVFGTVGGGGRVVHVGCSGCTLHFHADAAPMLKVM